MSWTQSDLDKLESAIATGARRVKFKDREVEYRSHDEMVKARELIRKKLGLTTAASGRKYYCTSKGTS